MVMTGIIIMAIFGGVFASSLVWYFMKVRAFHYTGRTLATVTEISEFTKTYSKRKKQTFYKFTAEYYADEKTYYIRRTIQKMQAEFREGGRIAVVYDEKKPKRYEFADAVAVPDAAVKHWRLVPIFALIIWAVVFVFLVPMIFGFSERKNDIYEQGTTYAMILAAAVSVVWKFGKKDKEQHGVPWRTLFVLLFWLGFLMYAFYIFFGEYI